ncbi:MAG TPA: thermonuclease family protein, partial [Vicinamibacterales bacterium]
SRVAGPLPVIVAVALALSGAAAGETVAQNFTATVVAVHDGDTITVRSGRQTIRIRLEGIDCPEYRQPFSARARRFTSEMVHRRTVTIEPRGRDQFDRLLARVYVNGIELNEALVRNGLAWHYAGRTPDPKLAAAERAARAARVGLWSQKNPVPPWEWRRRHAPVR